jgi:hypothetical protein
MRTFTLAIALVGCLCAAAQSSGLRIEITSPKAKDQMILTVNASPLRVTGNVHSASKVLLMLNGAKAEVKEDGSFAHDVPLDAGINRVILMAGNADGARTSDEFYVTLDVQAAVAVGKPEVRQQAEPPPAKEPAPETQPAEAVAKPIVQPQSEENTGVAKPNRDEQRNEPVLATEAPAAQGTLTRDEIMRGSGGQQAGASKPRVNEAEVFALVVGVSRYRYARTQDLRFADADAAAVAALLREGRCQGIKPDNVVLLQNTMARSEVIKAQLDALLARADENDIFLFYFSGHGMYDTRGQLCLLGADAEIDDPYKAWASSLTQAEVLTALNASPCRNKVMILDACRSGRATMPATAGERGAHGEVSILTAASASESSYESDDLQGGIFTHYLLKGLRGKADADGDGGVTMQELATYVAAETPREAQRTNHQQHPRYAPGAQASVRLCAPTTAVAQERPASSGARTAVEGASGDSEAAPANGDQRYDSYVVGEPKKTLINVLFTNTTTGDRIRFYKINNSADWIGISALIDGEIFAAHSNFRGGDLISFEQNERSNKIQQGRMHLSANWDQVEVEFSLADGKQVKSRSLYKTNSPALKTVGEGRVYGNQAHSQQLEVYDEKGEWVMLSGHLGQHLVQLYGQRKGDVLELTDREAEWLADGVAILVQDGTRLKGWLQFKDDGSVEQFDLGTLPPVKGRTYEGLRFDHPNNDQYLSFYDEKGGWVHFSGKVYGSSVQGRAQIHADLLDFHPDGGQRFLRGRMLLHEGGDRLMTRFVFPSEDDDTKQYVPLHLFRSN